jgi:hypothetical protein
MRPQVSPDLRRALAEIVRKPDADMWELQVDVDTLFQLFPLVGRHPPCTTSRFPSSPCASAIQIVRPLECTVNRNRAGSRLLFLAEFLESGICAQRVPDWIEF